LGAAAWRRSGAEAKRSRRKRSRRKRSKRRGG
jgi:hypothetical protein